MDTSAQIHLAQKFERIYVLQIKIAGYLRTGDQFR